MFSSIRTALAALLAYQVLGASGHLLMTYPGWRGDNLATNGTTELSNGLAQATLSNGSEIYPYGMQWLYPCGGLPTSTNRTKWPIGGGGVSFQPGWFTGHLQAVLYVNLGLGTSPPNMSLPMLGATGIIGPTNEAYPGPSVCFPQLPLPANVTVQAGDNATIQVIMLAQHGAALYSCVDITFSDPSEVQEITKDNCQNSSQIQFTQIYATSSLTTAAAPRSLPFSTPAVWLPLAASLAAVLLW